MTQGPREGRPYFLIVARDRALLLPLLQERLGGRTDLQIFLDRRLGERRRAARVAVHRRQADRRRGMARGPLRP